MNNKGNYKKGTRRDIIKTLHLVGIFPSKSLNVLENGRTYREKIKTMVEEDVVREDRVKNGRHTYRIIALNNYEQNKALYKDTLPDGYYETYVTYGYDASRVTLNKPGSVSQRRIGVAETHIMMKSAGIACEPDTKPNLYRKVFIDDGNNYYYSSRELKNYTGYKDEIKKIKVTTADAEKLVVSSRITGVAITRGGTYAVYNMGQTVTDWQAGGELKMKTHLDFLMGKKMENPIACDNALITTEDYASIARLLNPSTPKEYKSERAFENLKQAYRRVYGIPYDLTGKRMLEVMSSDRWVGNIKDAMLAGLTYDDRSVGYLPCHAITDKGEYVYCFCIPDITGLQRFLKYAEADGDKNKFIVMGFDYQMELLAKGCAGRCRVMKTGFEKFYEDYKAKYINNN